LPNKDNEFVFQPESADREDEDFADPLNNPLLKDLQNSNYSI